MAKKNKKAVVALLEANDAFRSQAIKGAKSDDYKRLIAEALDTTKSDALTSKMRECGTKDVNWGNTLKCGSPYCIRCFPKMVGNQKSDMAKVLNRHTTEADQRANIRWVTILFSVFGFDLLAKPYPTFPLDVAKDAKKVAANDLETLATNFPDAVWLGGYSWEAVRKDIASPYKQATIDALLDVSDKAGLVAPAPPSVFAHPMDKWRNHLITFHVHLVVDMAGTDAKAFSDYCHGKWGMGRGVPRGALITPLVSTKAVPASLDTLAVYPYLNQWIYKQSKADKQVKVSPTSLEPEVLSAMVSGLTDLKKSIRTKRKWE